MNYDIVRQNKQSENLAKVFIVFCWKIFLILLSKDLIFVYLKFDEILFNLAQADSIKLHLTDNTSCMGAKADLSEFEEQAEELIEKMKKTFRELKSFLMTQRKEEIKKCFIEKIIYFTNFSQKMNPKSSKITLKNFKNSSLGLN